MSNRIAASVEVRPTQRIMILNNVRIHSVVNALGRNPLEMDVGHDMQNEADVLLEALLRSANWHEVQRIYTRVATERLNELPRGL